MKHNPPEAQTRVERESIYIETTIPSYATARISTSLIIAGRQVATRLFWERERQNYDLYVSDYVVDECREGDADASQKRLQCIEGIALIKKSNEIETLAEVYRNLLNIPEKNRYDSLHLAAAVLNNINYLLSWNYKHLGSSSYFILNEYNAKKNLWTPKMVSPEHFFNLLEGLKDDRLL